MKNTLIYTNGGEIYHGSQKMSDNEITQVKVEQKRAGAVGYMIGHRNYGGEKERVLVFFYEKPENIEAEEQRRRENGFNGAKWYNLINH